MTTNATVLLSKYSECTLCPLALTRRHIVLGRGDIPADILFIGEGPGASEDALGKPFIGPAGKLLSEAIEDATKRSGVSPKMYWTNVVACHPTDKVGGENRQPNQNEMWKCWPRLKETVTLVAPKAIVLLGKVAQGQCSGAFPNTFKIMHPAYVLRERSMYLKFAADLTEVFELLKGRLI